MAEDLNLSEMTPGLYLVQILTYVGSVPGKLVDY